MGARCPPASIPALNCNYKYVIYILKCWQIALIVMVASSRGMRNYILFVTVLGLLQVPLRAQPTITRQPTNQVLALGGTMTLSVTTSDPLAAYQWFKDSRLLLGATNSTLAVTNAGVINSGIYYVLVTNGSGMVISLPCSVAVGNPSLLVWGNNYNGQLGVKTTGSTNVPTSVASNVVAGAAGGGHSLFVKGDGTL